METRHFRVLWLLTLTLVCPTSGYGADTADVAFLLDVTRTEHDQDLHAMTTFLASFVRRFQNPIDEGHLRLAAVTFARDVRIQFSFDECRHTDALLGPGWRRSEDSLRGCIGKIRHDIGDDVRDTAAAVRLARTRVFPNARDDVTKLLVLLTSGQPADAQETQTEAQQLQTAGVSLLVLSVGHHTDLAGLGQLATNRSFVLTTPGLDSLPHLSEGLQEVFMQLAHGERNSTKAAGAALSRQKRSCPSSHQTAPQGRDCVPAYVVYGNLLGEFGSIECFGEGWRSVGGCSFHVTVHRCPSLPAYHNGRRLCKYRDYRLWGTTCRHHCDDGYRLLPGAVTIECQRRSGSTAWSSTPSTCHELCTWRNSHCWPGDCASDLSANCRCRPGFSRKGTGSAALCQLATPPDLSTCRVSVTDSQGSVKNSSNVGNSTDCKSQRDEGIRTQPTHLYFAIKADLDLDLGNLAYYVSRSKVGVVGAQIDVIKISLSGTETVVKSEVLEGAPFCQRVASSSSPVYGGVPHDCDGTLTIPPINLKDGESLCADMQAFSGGFYDLIDEHTNPKGQVLYPRVPSKKKRVCFVYDQTKPIHCSERPGGCHSQPLQLSTRLTRHPELSVHVDGWLDPVPPGGTEKSPSRIDVYRVEVHGVDVNKTSLSVQENARTDHTVVWEASVTSRSGPYDVAVTLPTEEPRLYAVVVEVHDKAGNVGYARRLLLFDNSSTVQLLHTAQLKVVSADPQSGYTWQTDVSRRLCVDWRNRFYNSYLYSNDLLLPVETDTGREIYGPYDQTSGVLPTSGTDNVQGIVRFEMTWRADEGNMSSPVMISDVYAQSTCLNEQLVDGQTYDVSIKATDIMDNYEEESVRVYIDHTGPALSIEGLKGRLDRQGLYVHNTTDLSTMKLLVHAADPHSGLETLEWMLGTRALSRDVGHGSVGVHRLDNATDCQGADNCYCPSVGDCENHHYTFTFTSLVHSNSHQGDHHRDYHITITATNHASLRTTRTVDILLDDSPPTVGVVWEGLSEDGQAEMDFTSSDVLHVRWHGYEDHESGIMLYRLMLAERCMTGPEMEEAQNATEVEQGNLATIRIPREGLYFTSVVAYNGAMEPSTAACSDGIVYDTTPPTLLNVYITHGRSGRAIGCTQPGVPWLVHRNLTRVRLAGTTDCSKLCSDNSSSYDVEHLRRSSDQIVEEEAADDVCRKLPMMTEDSFIVLPSDYVKVTWAGVDDESDMEEYYVGMGRDRTTSSAPDLLPFTPTHAHPSYHARHSGLGHGDLFFIFLQAVNKAGLHVQRVLGPVVIDVTPPDVTRSLAAVVNGDVILVTWTDDVFVDPEQPKGVELDFSFRVGYEAAFVTPFLSLPDSALRRCRKYNVSGCARYPISALHAHDSEAGRSFFFQLHVTNAAGHVTSVNTSSVGLPAHFAPSRAVVMDVVRKEGGLETGSPALADGSTETSASSTETPAGSTETPASSTETPAGSTETPASSTETPASSTETPAGSTETPAGSTAGLNQSTAASPAHEETGSGDSRRTSRADFSQDVDAVVDRDEVCVAWSGIFRAEEVTVEVGIGSRPDQDDVLSFSVVDHRRPACFNLTSAPVYRKLFSVVRATNSGGTSLSSSDGFVMIPESDVTKNVRVFVGKVCTAADVVGEVAINESITTLALSSFISSVAVDTGDPLFVRFSPFVSNVTFADAVLLQTTLTGYQIVATSPSVTAYLPSSASGNTSVQVMGCLKDAILIRATPQNHVAVTWETLGEWTRHVKSLKVEVVDSTCLTTLPKKEKYRQHRCVVVSQRLSKAERALRVAAKDLVNGHTYFATLSPSFDDGYLPPASSRYFTYDNAPRNLVFQRAAIASTASRSLQVEVEVLVQPSMGAVGASGQGPCLLKWAVARDRFASTLLADWAIEESASCALVEMQERVAHSSTPRGSLYVCVQAVFPWKASSPSCQRLHRPAHLQQVEALHLIELSHRTFRQTDLDLYLHSHQLGSRLHDLYDLDLDFAESDVMLAAVLTFSEGRSVTWFLMTSPDVPQDGVCAGDARCVTSQSSDTGRVVFPRHHSHLQDGGVYYVCAQLTSSTVCGNGVVIDDSSPVAGTVSIGNAANGYLADNGHVLVTWTGFSDVETKARHLPNDVTLNYSVSLGSYPKSEDIAVRVAVGQRTTWTFDLADLAPGLSCVATVTAQDRVGHVTSAWSQPIIIDTTPPTVGHVAAGEITQERFVSGPQLSVRWKGVEDRESGIKLLQVAVTTLSGSDVIPFEEYEGSSAVLTDVSSLVDGHAYIVLLKVTNGAGLTTLTSSEPFIADSSPPGSGTVWNSASDSSDDHQSYVTEASELKVRWSGFQDPHSGLTYFRVALGSAPALDDVVPFLHVGLQTSHTWKEEFEHGTKYYTTVEACNGAGLCRVTSSSSVTFDNSPPTAGHVTVGFGSHHSKFLGHSPSLPVQWTGFADPQTGIREFSWCVGLAPGRCDVTNQTRALLSRAVHRAGLSLPVATPLYVTVWAVNAAGLDTASVSDSFTVDPTPPEVVTPPHFLSARDGSPAVSQWDRSVLRVAWEFRDQESSVVSHTVYIRSKATGRLVIDPLVLGADTELTVTLDKEQLLENGDRHWVSVTACNAASLCVPAVSGLLLVDSTPPLVGSLLSPLSWTRLALNVTWRGFADAESDVTKYYVIAGRGYDGDEASGGQVTAVHDNATTDQRVTMELKEGLKSGDVVYLGIWSENSLGLHSPVLRMAFDVLVDNAKGTAGTLVLVRHSCEVSYCTKECTCAPRGQVCDRNTASCQEVDPSSTAALPHLRVLPRMGSASAPQRFTTSATCLEGHWRLSEPSALSSVRRFQWAFSLTKMAAGAGVVDTGTESVWRDAGKNTTAVYCLPGKRVLTSGQGYGLHVRAWLSRDQHVTFTSPPVVVDHTPPQVKRGGAVLESLDGCDKDVDFITTQRYVTVCWGGVFRDSQSPVSQYEMWVGTTRYAENYLHKTVVGLNTTWNLETTNMEPGTRYYVSVRAQNEAGLHTTAVSDGIIVDVTAPTAGVVFNTDRHVNRHSQNSGTVLSASWHGFEDRHSGVTSYYVSVYDVDNTNMSLLTDFHAGFKNKYTLDGLDLQHGHRYRVSVRARDQAGLVSHAAQSPDLLVDLTPPQGLACTRFQLQGEATLLHTPTPSFLHGAYTADLRAEVQRPGDLLMVRVFASGTERAANRYVALDNVKMPLPFVGGPPGTTSAQHTFVSPESGNKTVSVAVDAEAGSAITARLYRCSDTVVSPDRALSLRQVSQHAVSVCARVRDQDSGLKTLMVGLGTTEGGLQVLPLTPTHHSGHVLNEVHVQHGSRLYATVVAENWAGSWSRFFSGPLVMDRTGPLVQEVKVTLSYGGEEEAGLPEVMATVDWTARDDESGSVTCTCTLEGQSTVGPTQQMISDVSPGRCQWQLRHPRHGVSVKAIVNCVNGIQLQTSVTSRPVQILLSPPDLSKATVEYLDNSAVQPPYAGSRPEVRSGLSSLQVCWPRLGDPTVSRLHLRFRHGSRPFSGWSPLEAYKTCAVVGKAESTFSVENVTAQVRAVNERLMTSDVISSVVRVDDSKPALTGGAATVTFNGEELELDWHNVFDVNRDVIFSVYAGTARGYGDVINHVVTKETRYSAVYTRPLSDVFLLIQAVCGDGASEVYVEEVHV